MSDKPYNHLGTRELFEFYMNSTKNPVKKQEFKDISNAFNKFLIEKVIEGDTVKLPERLGTLRIVGRKVKPRINPETGDVEGVSPDWKETRKLWERCPECKEKKQLVFHFNEHTDGIRYKFSWSKTGVFISNRDFYSFRVVRSVKGLFKKKLAQGKEYICEN